MSVVDQKSIENYPLRFIQFCEENYLISPLLSSKNGKALAAMLNHPQYYWTRDDCNEFCRRFQINSRDSIQLFNKHEQWGLNQSKERGKYYIPFPYTKSIKSDMRKNFCFDGTHDDKMHAINRIKMNIMSDYILVPNEKWQLGHKNPDSGDNSHENLVLQPPIQSKYRDDYIFIDSLTKIPTPKKIKQMVNTGESPYTNDQLYDLYQYLKHVFEK